MSEDNFNKQCLICGDRASGYNFNVLSCESCKAFFRRNAYKQKEFKCIFKNQCEIDLKNRKLCRFCRLKKCFTLGMKKEWILSEEQRKLRKNSQKTIKIIKIEKNKPKDSFNNSLEVIKDNFELINGDIDSLSDQTEDNNSVYSYTSSSEISDSFDDSDNSQILVAISRPLINYRTTLTEVEGNYLTELMSATKVLKSPIGGITSEATTLFDALHVLTSARYSDIHRFVTFAKSLRAFQSIEQTDRMSLIRPGSMELFYVRNVSGYFFDNDKEYYIVATDSEKLSTCLIDLDLFRKTKPYLYEAKTDFYRKFSREWDSDEIILDLLTTIVLFSPERCRVIDPQSVRLQQHIYKYLLQRYLLLKYESETEAKAKYWRLMNLIDCLHTLSSQNRQIVFEENILTRNRFNIIFQDIDI